MSASPAIGTQIGEWAHRQTERYRDGADRPLAGYLALIGIYTGGLTAVSIFGRLGRRQIPEHIGTRDLVLFAVATHRLSRTIAKDPITSPLRAPFTKYVGTEAPAELAEEVRGQDFQHSVGELFGLPDVRRTMGRDRTHRWLCVHAAADPPDHGYAQRRGRRRHLAAAPTYSCSSRAQN